MRCHKVRERLADREAPLSRREERHLARCAECRAELARYRSLDEGLVALETRNAIPPPGLEQRLAAIPAHFGQRRVRSHLLRNRATYAGGLAVLAGAAYWRTRARRLAAA